LSPRQSRAHFGPGVFWRWRRRAATPRETPTKKGGNDPLNHAALPRNAAQLKDLGVGYTNCAPTPEARLIKSLTEQATEARRLLG